MHVTVCMRACACARVCIPEHEPRSLWSLPLLSSFLSQEPARPASFVRSTVSEFGTTTPVPGERDAYQPSTSGRDTAAIFGHFGKT